MRCKIRAGETGEFGEDIEAAREVRDCGEMESMGRTWSDEVEGGFRSRNVYTSACDCIVIKTASADVMHPLRNVSMVGCRDRIVEQTCRLDSH